MLRRGLSIGLALLAFGGLAARAQAMGAGDTAALQVALGALGLYAGDVDGLAGPGTRGALRRFQTRAGLTVDGVVGPRTRAALGRRGRPGWGRRTIGFGDRGWDVARLQFELARHGFPSGTIDGGFGTHVQAALLRFQTWAGLPRAGVAGPATRRALRAPPPRSPLAIGRPVSAPIGDRFGPRGARWHTGVDFPAASGTTVVAARSGTVASVGDAGDGYGLKVVVDHGSGVRTLYAHLSAALVGAGAPVVMAQAIGRVGATGHATGPHLHFELLVRGAAIDPLSAMGAAARR